MPTSWPAATRRSRKPQGRLIGCVLIASVLPLSGCFAPRVIPDPTIPHRLSRDTTAWEWRTMPDGTKAEAPVTIPAGWWVAGPMIIEAEGPPAMTVQSVLQSLRDSQPTTIHPEARP